MQCSYCNSCCLETLTETQCVCTKCGLLIDTFSEIDTEFTKNKHARCVTYELVSCEVKRKFLVMLEIEWESEHVENVKRTMRDIITGNSSIGESELILGITMKYATENKIPFDYSQYKEKMNVSTKKLGKALRYLNAGVVSEGLCDVKVRSYIEQNGDTGIVRPVTLFSYKHPTSKSICSKMTNQTCKIMNHNVEGEELVVTISRNTLDKEQFLKYQKHIVKMYDYIKENMMNEGETITAALSVYVVCKKHNIFKSATEFCMKTRLTSVPTLKKMENKYAYPERISHFF